MPSSNYNNNIKSNPGKFQLRLLTVDEECENNNPGMTVMEF